MTARCGAGRIFRRAKPDCEVTRMSDRKIVQMAKRARAALKSHVSNPILQEQIALVALAPIGMWLSYHFVPLPG
jgi:hypothetical protein